jgi:hypothetical protein
VIRALCMLLALRRLRDRHVGVLVRGDVVAAARLLAQGAGR